MKSLISKKCKQVETFDFNGGKNGFLLEIASTRDQWSKFLKNSQIYMTTVLPKKKKGFHLHHKKENQFTCIKGNLVMAVWDGKKLREFRMGENNFITVRIPKGQAICFYNFGPKEAYLLNLCSPPYDPKDREQEDVDIVWNPKP